MNFYEAGSKGPYAYAKPIGVLPKLFWVIGVGSITYAVVDRYILNQDEKLRWRRAVMARVSTWDGKMFCG